MPTPTFLLLFFTASTIFGIWRSYRLLTTSRRANSPVAALYRWSGDRLSSWKYERVVSLAIVVHTSAMLILAAAGVVLAFKPATFLNTFLSDDFTIVVLVWFVECGCLAFTGFLLGALLGFPVASFEKKPVLYGVSEAGMIYGSGLLPWHWFSHFTIDPNNRLVRFFSSYASDLPSFMLQPPASVSLDELVGVLQQHLPQVPPPASRVGYHTKKALVPLMALFCLPLVVVSWLATRLPTELGLFTIALCAALVAGFGGQIISTYGFGPSYKDDMNKLAGQG